MAWSRIPTSLHHMIIHLIDGTYELFRHYYGLVSHRRLRPSARSRASWERSSRCSRRRRTSASPRIISSNPSAMNSGQATRRGWAWIPPLYAQFVPLEERLWQWVSRRGRWSNSRLTTPWHLLHILRAQDPAVEKVCIWTPDKDLAQCVSGARVVQVDRKSGQIRDEAGVRGEVRCRRRTSLTTSRLVGDAADGYPGIPKIGAKTAARLIGALHGAIEQFPSARPRRPQGARTALQETGDATDRRNRCSLTWSGALGAERQTRSLAWPSRMGAPSLIRRIAKLPLTP